MTAPDSLEGDPSPSVGTELTSSNTIRTCAIGCTARFAILPSRARCLRSLAVSLGRFGPESVGDVALAMAEPRGDTLLLLCCELPSRPLSPCPRPGLLFFFELAPRRPLAPSLPSEVSDEVDEVDKGGATLWRENAALMLLRFGDLGRLWSGCNDARTAACEVEDEEDEPVDDEEDCETGADGTPPLLAELEPTEDGDDTGRYGSFMAADDRVGGTEPANETDVSPDWSNDDEEAGTEAAMLCNSLFA